MPRGYYWQVSCDSFESIACKHRKICDENCKCELTCFFASSHRNTCLVHLFLFLSNSSTHCSGSGIRCLFDPLDPESGMGEESRSESGIRNRDEHPGSATLLLCV
jgi:predicted outer membrane repeat protein